MRSGEWTESHENPAPRKAAVTPVPSHGSVNVFCGQNCREISLPGRRHSAKMTAKEKRQVVHTYSKQLQHRYGRGQRQHVLGPVCYDILKDARHALKGIDHARLSEIRPQGG